MEASQFDRLARSFAARPSRRGALTGLLSGALALLLPDGGSAAKRGKHRGKGRDNAGRGQNRGKGRGGKHKKRRDKQRGPASDAVLNQAACYSSGTCAVGDGQNLAKCDLGGSASLKGRGCRSCNLSGSNLRGTDASGANLRNANLGGACLVDANLTGTNLSGANTRDAIFCRTRMPNGSINNSGCNKATGCCPTCVAIGGSGCSLGGNCCGGATCSGDTCVCPPDRSRNCNGVCQACCGSTDCASGVCCRGTCCEMGAVCNTRAEPDICCVPEARERTCPEGSCGRMLNNCGQAVECGECPVETCVASRCSARNRCERAVQADGQPGTNCPDPRVCCNGGCCAEREVCDTRGATPVCCLPDPRERFCREGVCGAVIDNCGQQLNCGDCPAQTCSSATCSGNRCEAAKQTDGASGTNCDDPRVCCDGVCCLEGEVCNTSGATPVCCVPEDRTATCPRGICGRVANNCGQPIDCGDCPERTCLSGACSTENRCEYTPLTNGTTCDADAVCCNGECCAAGAVCDIRGATPVCCTPRTTCAANACATIGDGCGGIVNCGACTDPARPICTGNTCVPCQDDLECGAEMLCCSGTCFAGECCAAADCPDQTCKEKACTNNQCAYTNLADGSEDPRGDCFGQEICIGGECGCMNNDQCSFFGTFCCNNRCGPGLCCNSVADCEPDPCRVVSCSSGHCRYVIAADGTNPGGLCPGIELCCDGNCVNLFTDLDHCGRCGNRCTPPQGCSVGGCEGRR